MLFKCSGNNDNVSIKYLKTYGLMSDPITMSNKRCDVTSAFVKLNGINEYCSSPLPGMVKAIIFFVLSMSGTWWVSNTQN